MYQTDSGAVATAIVTALLEELAARGDEDLVRSVEARLNSAAKAAEHAELADLQAADAIVGQITS